MKGYGTSMQKIYKYNNRNEYFDHQLKKTLKQDVIDNHKEKWDIRVDRFINQFKDLDLPNDSKILCVASRYGEEVKAFRMLGHNCLGIDLIDWEPYTIKMDMHNMIFGDCKFDIVYTNAIDHSWNIKNAIRELFRVVKNNGIVIIEIEFNNPGEYETVVFSTIDDITNKIDNIKYDLKVVTHKGESTHLWNTLIFSEVIK